ncbi:fatty acyl-CoA reductase wat-like isoform X2 [Belonocnema kinseyi]|uniref:fatty acyl-CoA reductase wat-like isoform X2 n=1 Tax=Belonocnema kinseyi TaxID=2817044 RepID=UPI00143CFDB3|nr:fatty acyl-CoA reductase wat-like isoform X2 [Belonocnema kinseyi]
MSKIRDFYEGQNVFISGGSGFIGKILIAKLLRVCPEIGKVYLLMRSKKGITVQERVDQILTLPIFESLKRDNPDFKKKIFALSGDLKKPGFGLSTQDLDLIVKEVSVVFHLAATTKFNEPFRVSVPVNVNSVMEIIQICRQCKNLKAAVYVSTAFSQCVNDYIEEKIYPMPLTYEQINKLLGIIEQRNFSGDEEVKFTKSILGKFPNTYIFTKAISEGMLNEKARDLPFCIFRFSIALATYREPVSGWVDILQGFNQSLIGIGMGAIRVLFCNVSLVVDLVPADFVCNALIASAWETGTMQIRRIGTSEDLPVYNYVSGKDNPLTWKEFSEHFEKGGPHYPPSNMIYFPDAIVVKNPILYSTCDFFIHLIPALLGDVILRILRKKPMLYIIHRILQFMLASFFIWLFWKLFIQN